MCTFSIGRRTGSWSAGPENHARQGRHVGPTGRNCSERSGANATGSTRWCSHFLKEAPDPNSQRDRSGLRHPAGGRAAGNPAGQGRHALLPAAFVEIPRQTRPTGQAGFRKGADLCGQLVESQRRRRLVLHNAQGGKLSGRAGCPRGFGSNHAPKGGNQRG